MKFFKVLAIFCTVFMLFSVPTNASEISTNSTYTQDFTVEEGSYYILINYKSSDNLLLDDNVIISIDDSENIYTLPKKYVYETDEFGKDRYGNDVIPTQSIDTVSTNSYYIKNVNSLSATPDEFKLDSGTYSLEIKSVQTSIEIINVSFINIEQYGTSNDIIEENSSATPIVIEAEKLSSKNDLSINSIAEPNSNITPIDPKYNLINTINGKTFNTANQQINYTVEITEPGYYIISLYNKVPTSEGVNTYINVYVDSEIQTEELDNIVFNYSSKYEQNNIEEPIYLSEGEHEITFEISGENVEDVRNQLIDLNNDIIELNSEISRITGGTVDENRDWALTTFIPDVEERLDSYTDTLDQIRESLLELSDGVETQYINSIDLMISNIEELKTNPDNIPNNLEYLSSGSTSTLSLSTSLQTQLQETGMSIDKLAIYPSTSDFEFDTDTGYNSLTYNTSRFFSSFSQEETSDLEYDTEIEVWIKRPRQNYEVLQQLLDEQFTPETGIKVNLSIVTDQNKFTMANAAGEAPDVGLGLDAWYIYQLGGRGALLDLTDYDEAKNAASNMSAGGLVQMVFDDKIYGLPETQDFYMMYTRDDIFTQNNYQVPNTWDDVSNLLPSLQSYGTNFYLPIAGGSSFKTFPSTGGFFLQNDAPIYSDDGSQILLDQENQQESLAFMTNLFTLYGLPLNTPNFYDSFREGTIPEGVSNFSTYIQLTYAAPELAGKWSVDTVPGVQNEDGSVNKTMPSGTGVQGAAVFNDSEEIDSSLQFLEWWFSDDIQTEYTQRMLSTYGPEYIWNSSNTNAFASLPLPEDDMQVMLEMLDNTEDIPLTPASYVVERGVSDIWNAVIFDGESLKAQTDEQIDIMNQELNNRYIEFGYADENGNMTKDYNITTREDIERWIEDE